MKGGYKEKYGYNERFSKRANMHISISKNAATRYINDRSSSITSMEKAK